MADAKAKTTAMARAREMLGKAFFGTAKKAIDSNILEKGVKEFVSRLSIVGKVRDGIRPFVEPRGPSKPPPIKWGLF